MLTLTLLRHAKSSWAEPKLTDFARPLAPRGHKAGPIVAAWLGANLQRPDRVLCSPAVRTLATWALVADAWGTPRPPCDRQEALYMASTDALLAIIRAVPKSAARVMVIGHNPGLHELAILLTGQADDPAQRAAIAAKFPTAGVAVLTFGGSAWATVKPGGGRLLRFTSPKAIVGRA
jgi:phosphohistidine phosphatase